LHQTTTDTYDQDVLDWVEASADSTSMIRKDLRLDHGSLVFAQMKAENGALRTVRNVSESGVRIDRTPPAFKFVHDGNSSRDAEFFSSKTENRSTDSKFPHYSFQVRTVTRQLGPLTIQRVTSNTSHGLSTK